MAIGVRESARRLSIEVPGELSIIGIDDYVLAEVLGLTTVRQDVAAQGRAAATMLLAALAGHQPGWPTSVAEELLLPTELVVRESTARVGTQPPTSSPESPSGSRR